MLNNAPVAATVPTAGMEKARDFYENALGLQATQLDENGVFYTCGQGTMFSVYYRPGHVAAGQTVAAWQVDDIEAAVHALAQNGVVFEQYDMPEPGIKTDAHGIADLGSLKGAWFKDPDGNILGMFQM